MIVYFIFKILSSIVNLNVIIHSDFANVVSVNSVTTVVPNLNTMSN